MSEASDAQRMLCSLASKLFRPLECATRPVSIIERPLASHMPIAPPIPSTPDDEPQVLRLRDIRIADARALLGKYKLELVEVEDGAPIPGSFWGDDEAGVIGSRVYARRDTPVHSLLHESCHLIVLPAERRAAVHTDATDSVIEEDASCYLQILLADQLPGVGSQRVMRDMDRWGYTFRLGSAAAWFAQDAGDARAWLAERGLLPELQSVDQEAPLGEAPLAPVQPAD